MDAVHLIVTGEILVSDPDSEPLRDCAVAIRDGAFVAVGSRRDILSRYAAERILERPSGLIIPGLINAHTHAAMTIFRGLADDLPLKRWLEEYIFPAEARLTHELVALGTELACAEMIRCGTTGFVDMYLFESAVSQVVDRVGMRGWLGEGIFDFPTPAFPSGEAALKETERLISAWKGHPLITITVDPHTPYTCASWLLEGCRNLADRNDALLVTHLAETWWEDGEIRRRHGVSPTAYLDSLGLLSDRLLATHCVAVGPEDMELMARRRVNVAHCPESNLKLGSGVAPVPEMLRCGITVALGTDGAASNNDLDLMSEMDSAAKIPKGVHRDPTLVSAREAFGMATTRAATALHREDLGRIAPGMRADLAVVDLDQVHLRPCYDPISLVVYAARSGDVQDVLVEGRPLLEDRRLVTIDEAALLARLGRIMEGMA